MWIHTDTQKHLVLMQSCIYHLSTQNLKVGTLAVRGLCWLLPKNVCYDYYNFRPIVVVRIYFIFLRNRTETNNLALLILMNKPCPPNSHEHCNLSLKDHIWLNKDFKLLTVNNIIEVKRMQSLLKLPIFLQDIKADSASKLLHWN